MIIVMVFYLQVTIKLRIYVQIICRSTLTSCKMILKVNFWAGFDHILSVVDQPLDAHIFEVVKL